jgi:hypothetical protein
MIALPHCRPTALGFLLAVLTLAPGAADAACQWDYRFKPRLWVCDDPNPPKPAAGTPPVDDQPLKPIIVPNSGAFATPAPERPANPCPPGKVLTRTGVCWGAGDNPCPRGQVLTRTGRCVRG